MASSIESIKNQIELLKIEQEEERRQHSEKLLKLSLAERKSQGITWYPIIIKESYYGYGDRLILEIERPSDQHQPHSFQHGCTAALFSNHPNYQGNSIQGVVSNVRYNQLRITLHVDELPEWSDLGKLGLNLVFDDTSFKEMNIALLKTSKAEHNRLAQLRNILLGDQEPSFRSSNEQIEIKSLNQAQNQALNLVQAAQDVAIIHGPPGTGKTTTLVQIIKKVLENEKTVLVCAPSNTAVDLLAEKLSLNGLRVIRFGNPARVSEQLNNLTVEAQSTAHPEFKKIKEYKKRASEFKNFASKYKRNFGREEREQRKMILEEAKKLHGEAEQIEKYIIDDLLKKAQVIACTLVGAAHYTLRELEFSTAFIDEAGQALEAACWIPISKSKRVIMAGDHLQLPPTIKSMEAANKGLKITLMEKLMEKPQIASLLNIQYRMHENIMQFSNQEFYNRQLVAHESVAKQSINPEYPPFNFIDTAGCGFVEEEGKDFSSLLNTGEADIVMKHLEALPSSVLENNTIGIISPYKAQVNYLSDLISDNKALKPYKISVNTVDGFQGQEKDVIYISLVRSNSKGEIGFLADTRRMNVAITRAKKMLVIVGDSATIASHSFYNRFIEYAGNIHAHHSAWEYMHG
jgi:superfamily I DNA and/or RNA helicase